MVEAWTRVSVEEVEVMRSWILSDSIASKIC